MLPLILSFIALIVLITIIILHHHHHHHHHRQSTHKSKQKCHLNDANVKIHHKRVDFSGLPILPEPPRDVEQDRLEEEINIFVNLYSILTGISHEMPRTPSIVTDNKSLNLVWFKWGSQWWGIVKHFPQSRCILISHCTMRLSVALRIWNIWKCKGLVFPQFWSNIHQSSSNWS